MLKVASLPCNPTSIKSPISTQSSPFTFTTTSAASTFQSKQTLFIQTSQSLLPFSFFSPISHRRYNPNLRCSSPTHDQFPAETPQTQPHNSDGVLPSPLPPEETLKTIDSELANQSIWNQIAEIINFSGPAAGLWLCGPLMSLIDTAVIGQTSSIELAALGPGTVFCDYMSYVFMFLCIATSNMVATSLAQQDDDGLRRQISILLFVALTCGVGMLVFTKSLGLWALSAFTGPKNAHLLPAANTYVQIRGLAWPANLVGWVAQSASLGMKDSWGPLKALAAASVINLVGDIVLCLFFGYGIAGAAWATAASQIVAAYMMVDALNKKGYNAYSISAPTPSELLQIFVIAAPVFITIASKVAFYSLLIYFATSMGTNIVAAHQVMLQTFGLFSVWGEPLSQTAQSFMPELIYGANRNLDKARMLLKSLLVIGGSFGLILGVSGTCLPWFFPNIFTPDLQVIGEMHKVLIPFCMSLSVTALTHSCEGSLLAGRDLTFISLSMSGCLVFASLLVLVLSSQGFGLSGCWYALVAFQWARLSISLRRLLSPGGFLFSEDVDRFGAVKLKAT